jgi:hypothetical protein
MPASLQGAVALRKAIKKISPETSKAVSKEISGMLRSVTNKARGFVPSEAPLSGWGNEVGEWSYRAFKSSTVKAGIGFSTVPSKPNKRGFRSLARIFNKSAAGAIYETAGRKSGLDGQPVFKRTKFTPATYVETGKEFNRSWNPNAGKQFIAALPPLVDSQAGNIAGRRTRKTKGRLIFRAWAEDNGKTNAAIIKAFESSMDKVLAVKKGNDIVYRGR